MENAIFLVVFKKVRDWKDFGDDWDKVERK